MQLKFKRIAMRLGIKTKRIAMRLRRGLAKRTSNAIPIYLPIQF